MPWLLPAIGLLAAVASAPPLARADELTREVQEELRKRNLYFGDIDGRSSAELAGALRRYQDRKGFAVTGAADLETLRSFNLASPESPASSPSGFLPQAAAAETNSAETPAAPWPDVPVLRSDQARLASPAPANPSPTHPAASASPAVSQPPRPEPDAVRAFVAHYLQAGQTNDPAAEMRFYGDKVDYFDDGLQNRAFVDRDVRAYDHRWPQRRFILLDPVTIGESPGDEPSTFTVNFRYDFTVSNSRYTVHGRTDNTWTVTGSGPEGWRIVALQERRVRGK